jgi:hypothetical protein
VPPPARQVAAVPKGHPPAERATRVPKARPPGKPPNPKKPKLVRDVGGGILKDMFAIFPDLPRPVRPHRRRKSRVTRVEVRGRKR